MSEAYGWNPETGAYQKISEMNVFRSGKGGSGKFISLSLRDEPVYTYPQEEGRGTVLFQYVRLNLIGFDSSDIGKKIYLYKAKKKHPKQLIHPRDYIDEQHTNIEQLGVGTIKKRSTHVAVYHPVYQRDKGLMQTEWELTAEDIQNKYIEINLSLWCVNLLYPYQGIETNKWDRTMFYGGCRFWFRLEEDITTQSEQITLKLPNFGGKKDYFDLETLGLFYQNQRHYLAKGYTAPNPQREGDYYHMSYIKIRID